ncbi:MAG: ABC transporter permease, partial [Candidatus Izemoplasmatales bacterium]
TGTLNLKKTSMSYATAFVSSINNIKTKLGRTILTAFAGSIGIIGIALILSLSNGMDQEIDNFEKDTLSSYPVLIEETSFDILGIMNQRSSRDDLVSHPDIDYITPEKDIAEDNMIENTIDVDYERFINDYLEGEGEDTLSGYSFEYKTNMALLADIDDTQEVVYVETIDSSGGAMPPFFNPNLINFHLMPEGEIYEENYEIVFGDSPVQNFDDKEIEVLLSISSYNQLSKDILEALGYDRDNIDENTQINYADIIGKEFQLYVGEVNAESDFSDVYTVRISGITRTLPDSKVSLFMRNGLVYTSEVSQYLQDTHPDEVGGIKTISLYPNNFDDKEKLIEYLDSYNIGRDEESSVYYTDQSEVFISISSGIIDAISIVLIAFASISLVVSSIMISIITYVSVIERTKEIGVLRALGARKKDVSRVFNTENIIIGFSAGLTGIVIALLLIIPINIILENLSDIPNIAKLAPIHIISLVLISIFLAFVAGLIPARMAAKKDPVVALRTE